MNASLSVSIGNDPWPVVSLSEVVDLLAGFPFKSPRFLSEASAGVPLVKGENVSQGRILWSISRYWPKEELSQYEKFHLRPGDVVLAMDRPWVPAGLKWAFIRADDPTALLVQRCARLRSGTPNLHQDFLRYVIGGRSFEDYIRPITTGVNVPHISGAQILAFRFALPPVAVQRRIAGILSAYDDLIENCTRRIRVLDEMARALYREWFVLFRYPGHENIPLVESSFGVTPRDWRLVRFDEIVQVHRGRSYRSTELTDEGGLPFINLKCIDRDGGFRRSGLKRFSGECTLPHVVRRGDIVVAVTDMTQERRIVARAGRVPSLDTELGIFSMDLVRIEPRNNWPTEWVYAYLRFSPFADHLKQHANGANVLHLSPDRIRENCLSAPPIELARHFDTLIAPSIEAIDTLENRIENLRNTRDLLLPRLLSGQLDLEDAA